MIAVAYDVDFNTGEIDGEAVCDVQDARGCGGV
jgi:hypothetical protein